MTDFDSDDTYVRLGSTSSDRPPTPVTDFDLGRLLGGLESCRRRLRDVRPRFAESPAHAVGYFLEGPGDPLDPAFHSPDTAARFLDLPAGRVVLARSRNASDPYTREQSGPYCLYLPEDGSVATEAAQAALARQLAALKPIFDALSQTLNAAPCDNAGGRLPPAWGLSWWEALFHLAVHFPTTFLQAIRERWGQDAREADGTAGPTRREESLLQFDRDRAFRDEVPGFVWVQLRGDVWTATEQAIEDLIAHLTRVSPPLSPPEAFAELLPLFQEIGRSNKSMMSYETEEFARANPEYSIVQRLVKVASTFVTGPVPAWCDFPIDSSSKKLLLARHNAEAEYFLYRGLYEEDEQLWAAAGEALSPDSLDSDLMFSTPECKQPWCGGAEVGLTCGPAFLNPDPKARWVRFVYTIFDRMGIQTRWNDTPTGPVCEVDYAGGTTPPLARWRDTPAGPAGTGFPIYGDAALPCDFATASAIVIKKAIESYYESIDNLEKGVDKPPHTIKPDGPFEPFGFRYQGREVDFAAAPLRHALLAALWDAEAEQPFESRTTAQVLDLVYPDDDEADAKLKNLKAETNKALLRAEVPLAIKSGSAKYWLKPSP